MNLQDRVRVKLTPLSLVIIPAHHWSSLNGQTGTVSNVFCALEDRAPMATVEFDKPVKLGEMRIIRRSFPHYDLEKL
jgi:hypothetical protein